MNQHDVAVSWLDERLVHLTRLRSALLKRMGHDLHRRALNGRGEKKRQLLARMWLRFEKTEEERGLCEAARQMEVAQV